MPSSLNPDWFQTVGQVCLSAALELGALGMGDSLEASEESEMITRLNSMMAKWSIEANLFREETATITVTGGTGTADMDSAVRDIRSIRLVETNSKRPLTQWNRDQFFALPNRAQSGNPVVFYYSQRVGVDQIYVWPIPSADVDLEIDYNRKFYFAEGPEQELDLPSEWHEAVLYGLASRSAGIFGSLNLNPAAVQRCDQQAKTSYEKMLDSDRPDSYYFEYDSPVEAR